MFAQQFDLSAVCTRMTGGHMALLPSAVGRHYMQDWAIVEQSRSSGNCFHCYVIAQQLPSPTYAIAMSLY